MTGRRMMPAALGLGLLGSQAGHLLAYQMRFGAAAQQLQSTGAHSYFPILARNSLGAIAIGLVGSLFVIGLARVLAGRAAARTVSRPSYLGLVATLFTVQLACFIAQEVGEALVAGLPPGSAAHLLLWGTLGQLPVAAVSAMALTWLSTRFEAAIEEIRTVLATRPASLVLTPVTAAVRADADRSLLLSRVAGSSLAKRGPPYSSSIGRR